MPSLRSKLQTLLAFLAVMACLTDRSLRAAERPLILQGAPAVVARLLDPYRELIANDAQVALIIVANDAVKGLTALLDGRADVALLAGDCEADLATVHAADASRGPAILQVFEIDRLGGKASSFVTRDEPTPSIRRLIDTARRIAAAHPF